MRALWDAHRHRTAEALDPLRDVGRCLGCHPSRRLLHARSHRTSLPTRLVPSTGSARSRHTHAYLCRRGHQLRCAHRQPLQYFTRALHAFCSPGHGVPFTAAACAGHPTCSNAAVRIDESYLGIRASSPSRRRLAATGATVSVAPAQVRPECPPCSQDVPRTSGWR